MKKTLFALLLSLLGGLLRAEAQTSHSFPYVTTPSVVCDQEWYALHFWDKYDFSNPYKYTTELTRQGFVEFLAEVGNTTSPATAQEAMRAMMTRAAASEDGYWCQLELAEMILYDPSSPLRDDFLWEPVMRHAIGPQSPLDEDSKMRYRTLLSIVERNQQGTLAANFTYTLPNGNSSKLHNLTAAYTLIYFYNPGCSECLRTKNAMLSTGHLQYLHERGLLKVLALYPDSDLAEWRRLLPENPAWWISAYDKGSVINTQELYDLKAIPTIYLLDDQKRVILKDPTVERLLEVLDAICSGL